MVQGLGPTGLKAAGLYAAASILGVTFLPVGIVSVLLGGDSAVADYDTKFEMVYEELVKIIQKNNGRFKVQERSQGIIKAVVQECDVAVKLATIRNKTKVTVSARKLLIPKPEVAGGIIHQLSEKIN
jgi:predicted ABC-type sugar transport system permease subunit